MIKSDEPSARKLPVHGSAALLVGELITFSVTPMAWFGFTVAWTELQMVN